MRGDHAGKVRRAAGAGDEAFHPLLDHAIHPFHQEVGRAVRGQRARLVRHAEVLELTRRVLHHVPVVGAAHHDSYQGGFHGAWLRIIRRRYSNR